MVIQAYERCLPGVQNIRIRSLCEFNNPYNCLVRNTAQPHGIPDTLSVSDPDFDDWQLCVRLQTGRCVSLTQPAEAQEQPLNTSFAVSLAGEACSFCTHSVE